MTSSLGCDGWNAVLAKLFWSEIGVKMGLKAIFWWYPFLLNKNAWKNRVIDAVANVLVIPRTR